MFEIVDSSNTQKMNDSSVQQVLQQNLSWFVSQHRKTLVLTCVILNPKERA